MEQNPYESPRHEATETAVSTGRYSAAAGCWSVVVSFGVLFVASIIALMMKARFGDWIELPAWIALSAIGMTVVWGLYWAGTRPEKRIIVQNDEPQV